MKLKDPQPRAALIASFDAFTAWGEPLAQYADVSKEEREDSKTMADGSYPIKSCTGEGPTVESAVHAVGRGSGSHDGIRKHIIEAANDLGCDKSLIPDNWNSDGSLDEAKTSAKLAAEAPKAPPVKAEAKKTVPPKAEGPDPDADANVAKAIDAAIEAQEQDPDKSDPKDVQILKLLREAQEEQKADTDDSAPKPVAAAGTEQCANCGHLASAHGEGACSMEGCDCPGMKEETDLDKNVLAIGEPAVPGGAPTAPADDIDLNPPPAVEGSDALGAEFSGVLVIEGQPTGDKRSIAPDALTWREPPLPLMLLATETHDPEGFDMNDPAVMAGRIETISREAGEGSTQLVRFGGHFLTTEDGLYAAELTEQMGRMGVSADIAVQDREIQITDADEYGLPLDGEETLTEGILMGGTACPYPAFQGCYIVLGDGTDAPEAKAIPQAAEQPEVVTAGGQLIHLMSYEECSACDDGIEVLAAAGAGPTRPPGAWFKDPCFTEGDGRLVEIYGKNGRLEEKFACPITVTEQGQVFGHLAPWNICHTAIGNSCVVAPKSAANYAHFMRGQHVITAEGEKVRVGLLTADIGHAPTSSGLSATAAMSHYDDSATVVADVTVGEDSFGIWCAGAIRPEASEEQIRKLRAGSLSGDWRNIGGQLELVAALCVNQPGFPLAVVAHGQQEALIAYGASTMAALRAEREPVDLMELAKPALARLVRRDARERIGAL